MQNSTNISSTFSEYCTGYYGFGFNGKESDKEVYGEKNSYDFGARIYDTRTGRWLACDALMFKYPNFSPYSNSLCNPINCADKDGKLIVDRDGRPVYTLGEIYSRQFSDGTYEKCQQIFYYTNDGKKITATKSLGIYINVEKEKLVFDNEQPVYKKVIEEEFVRSLPEDNLYDCHAYVLLVSRKNSNQNDKVWIASVYNNKDNINLVYDNESEYKIKTIKIEEAKAGYVAVFRGKDGIISHSSIYNGDGTFSTKDENDPYKSNATYSEQQQRWGECIGFFEKEEDKKTEIKSKDGQTTERKIRKTIK